MTLPLFLNGTVELADGSRLEVFDGRLMRLGKSTDLVRLHAVWPKPAEQTQTEADTIFCAMFLDCNATHEQRRAWTHLTSGQRRTAAGAVCEKRSDELETESALDAPMFFVKQSEERLASLRIAVGMPDGATWSHSYCCARIDDLSRASRRLDLVGEALDDAFDGDRWRTHGCEDAGVRLLAAEAGGVSGVRQTKNPITGDAANQTVPMFVFADIADGKIKRFELLTQSTGMAAWPCAHPWGAVTLGDAVKDFDDGSYAMAWCVVDGDARIVASKLLDIVAESLPSEPTKTPFSLTRADLGAIAAVLAPGEALDFGDIIARATAYRRHSIELAAIRAAVDSIVHTEVSGVDPFPWDACEDAVNSPHEKVCALLEAVNASADTLAKVRKPIEEALHENAIETEGIPEAIVDEIIQDLRERRQWGFVVRTSIRHEWAALIRRVASSSQPAETPDELMTVAQVEAWLISNGCVVKSSPAATSKGWTYTEATDVSTLDPAAYEAHGCYVCWTSASEPVARTLDTIEKVLGRRPS